MHGDPTIGWQNMGEGLLSVQRMLCAFDVPLQSNPDSLFDIGFFKDFSKQSTIPHFSPNKGIAIDGDLEIWSSNKIHEE